MDRSVCVACSWTSISWPALLCDHFLLLFFLQEVCTQYWSAKDSQQEFGEFVVTQKKIHHNQGFTCRTLLITNTAVGVANSSLAERCVTLISSCCCRVVTHVRYPSIKYWVGVLMVSNTILVPSWIPLTWWQWPSVRLLIVLYWCTAGTNITRLSHDHCVYMCIMHYCCYSDGVSRSAMLCAAMATLEQTRSHAMVDVFQIVKKMRSQLLGAIRSWVCSDPTLLFLMTAPCAPSYWKEYSSSYYPLLTHASNASILSHRNNIVPFIW